MYRELQAMAYLAGCLNLDDIAVSLEKEAAVLKGKVQEHCWDPRDRFYYSVDLNLLPVEKPDIKGLYPGQLFLHVGSRVIMIV